MMTTAHSAGRAPLTGRERERSRLREHFAAARVGDGSTVLLTGDAGIGKTALVEDLTATALAQGTLMLQGSGRDLTTPQPFALWIEAVAEFERAQAAMLDQPIEPPALLSSTAAPEAAEGQAQLFEAALQYFTRLAQARPLLIVLEDLHWSDRESLDLFRVVARQLRGQAALLIGTYRARELEPDAWLARLIPHLVRETRAAQIDLAPLDEASITDLVACRYDLADDDLQRLASYLARHAEGNPLFTLELLRDLESSRRLREAQQGWKLEELEPLPLPIFLRQVIDARLAKLPPAIRKHLAVAAIIGHEFPLTLWGASCGLSETELLDTLEQSILAGLLETPPDGRRARFTHALFHRALYESVLPPRRGALHREIGAHLAATATPDPDEVAWHFQTAGDERAAPWLIRAAERAQRAYAWRAAAERLIAAEALVAERSSGAELGWLRYRIGRLLRHSDTAAAIQRLRQAEQLGAWARDPALTAYARFGLGHTEVLGGEFARGLERMISGDALLDELSGAYENDDVSAWVTDVLPDSPVESVAHRPTEEARVNPRRGTLVQWLVEPGRYGEAWALGTGYLDQLKHLSAPSAQHISSEGDTWYALGRIHAAMGRPEEAREAFARSIECYERINHHLLVGATRRALLNEVVIPYHPDRPEERQALVRQAEAAHAQAAGVLSSRLLASFVSAEVLLLEGQWKQARQVLTPVAERGASIASVWLSAVALLGRLACYQGHGEEAWERVRQGLPAGLATEPGDTSFVPAVDLMLVAIGLAIEQDELPLAESWSATLERWLSWSGTMGWQATAALARARIDAAGGDLERASEHAMAAAELARTTRQPLTLLATRRLLGKIDLRQGDIESARIHLESALEMARACTARYEIALTELGHAEVQHAGGNREAAARTLASARQTLTELAAEPALARADTLQGRLDEKQPTDARQSHNLSRREREVLRLVAAGMTDAEVADELSISYRTVTTHLTSIFNKLGVNSRVLATRYAVENDLL